MGVTRIGIVGCGDISGIYLKNLTELYQQVKIAHLCDVVEERVRTAAENCRGARWSTSVEELLGDPQVDIVLNLSRSAEHFAVSAAALKAGKHVYSEKPLGITLEEGKQLVELAEKAGLRLGCAPDTFLGGSFQTCREIIESGTIGKVVGGSAFMVCRGHESWHPNPDFYYQPGGGPMLDMGPYYITVLINLLGPVKTVCGMTRQTFSERTITSQPRCGEKIPVYVSTHAVGLMAFQNGVVVSLLTTFDACRTQAPAMEIYGTEGTLQIPDPDWFGGEIRICQGEGGEYTVVPDRFPYSGNCRGLGIADMARAVETGRAARADAKGALHALEVMCAFEKSSGEGRFVEIETPFQKPELMKNNLTEGILD